MLQQPQVLDGGTTRRFPRTLNEAFPIGAEYGCAITRYRNPNVGFWAGAVCLFLTCFVVASWI